MPPEYQFSNPKNPEEVISIFQSMNEKHEYARNGVKWNRVWTAPQMAMDTIVDPYNEKDFVKKTQKGGTMGDLFDLSSEMSYRRRNYDGVDPIKEKTVKERKEKDAQIVAERRRKNAEAAKIKRENKSQ